MRSKLFIASVVMVATLLSASAMAFLDVDQSVVNTLYGGPIGEKQSQTFTTGASTNYFTAFAWKVWNPGATTSVDFTLRTFVAAEANPSYNWDNGAILATKSVTFTGAADGDWLTIVLDTPVAVTPNTPYNAFITNTGGYGGYYHSNVDPYAGGVQARVVSGEPYSIYWGKDLTFRTYGETVPEPATMALLGLGGIALLRKRRA